MSAKKGRAFVKVFLAVAICKILYFVGSRVGRGSSLPGQVALKVCPGVLNMLKLPRTIIAVTGSNGKTSTAELIAHVLKENGKSVAWNHEGSNQTEGVATLLLRIVNFKGVVKRDALVLECDERYARFIFADVKPSIVVVTNLCRDQLSRNGHPEFIFDCIQAAIGDDKHLLLLNADDPYVAVLGASRENVVWFGLDREVCLDPRLSYQGTALPCYDDGAFCPVCKSQMVYEYRIAGHFGGFNCSSCGHSRRQPDIEVTGLAFTSLTSAYNLSAAVTAAVTAGIDVEDAVRSLDGYELKGGRKVSFSAGGREGTLLISKHENSLSYNQSMAWVVEQHKPCTVVILVDEISRKYYTSETSWLWDVDFDILAAENVLEVVLAGRYSNELMARIAMSAAALDKCRGITSLADLREHIEKNGAESVYAITCFSDKAKLLKAFQ